jgi:hypothetical protein
LGWKIRDNLEMCELNDLRAVVERWCEETRSKQIGALSTYHYLQH